MIKNENKGEETLYIDDVNISGIKGVVKKVDEPYNVNNSLNYANNVPAKNKEERGVNNLDNAENNESNNPKIDLILQIWTKQVSFNFII